MEIGRPKRKYTIEPIRDPVKREQPSEQPATQPEPVREQPRPVRVGTP